MAAPEAGAAAARRGEQGSGEQCSGGGPAAAGDGPQPVAGMADAAWPGAEAAEAGWPGESIALSAEQLHWVRLARQAGEQTIGPAAAETDRTARYPHSSVEALCQAGLLSLAVPQRHGGAGGGFRGDVLLLPLVLMELASWCSSTSQILALHNSGVQFVHALGDEAQQQFFFAEVMAGNLFGSFGSEGQLHIGQPGPAPAGGAGAESAGEARGVAGGASEAGSGAAGPGASGEQATAPGASAGAPSARAAAPSAKAAALSARAAAPSVSTATPSASTATPSASTATPSASTATPSARAATPSARAATPSARSAAPSAVSVLRAAGESGGYVLTGRKMFATGSPGAKWAFWRSVLEDADGNRDSRPAMPVVRLSDAGVAIYEDWDGIGQRGTGSGTVVAEQVRIPCCQLLGNPGEFTRFEAFFGAQFHIHFAAQFVGMATGAIRAARGFLRAKEQQQPPVAGMATGAGGAGSSAVGGSYNSSANPVVHLRLGELSAKVAAARQAVLHAARLLQHYETEPALRDQIQIAALQAKIVANDMVLEVTGDIFQVLGARAATRSQALDIYYRNARTLTLHDPVDRLRETVGRYELGLLSV